ncbi:XRE family transcriptional regulator, partial [Candidatus Nomurabacteria bacterium]|nr:XRE family transcriptional regulator [Candidatus Nomurabacteria bacterium]
MDERIKRLEKQLLLIRRALGWSATLLGEKLGVSRQTINNIESGRTRLSKTEYLLLRRVLDDEMNQSSEETKMVKTILLVVVDHPEICSEKERQEILSKAEVMAPAIITKPSERKSVSKTWSAVLLASGVIVTTVV